MKPLPTDPFAFQARVFGALCDDLLDIASGQSSSCERTNALRQISQSLREKQSRERGGSNVVPVNNGD